jgi:hypothetical protein
MRGAPAKSIATTAVAVAMTLAVPHGPCAAQGVASSDPASEAAGEEIRGEVRAFYRDLKARDWATVLIHFWPAKITARWEPPTESGSWNHGSTDAPSDARGSGSTSERPAYACARDSARELRPDVRIEGRWARVMVTHCATNADELWLLDVNGRWKIVRLVLGY